MSRILKSGQTVLDGGIVNVYAVSDDGGAKENGVPASGGEPDGDEWDEERSANRFALISEEKRRILEHARQQAQRSAAEVLEEAYAQRDKIINTASEEAERIRSQARREGYEAGIQDSEMTLKAQLSGINRSVDEIRQEYARHERAIRDKIVDLALKIAGRILKKTVEEDSASLAPLVESVVMEERDRNSVTIHVSEQAAGLVKRLETTLEPLKERPGAAIRLRTEAEPVDYIRLETEDGLVDASVSIQLANLKRQLEALEKLQV